MRLSVLTAIAAWAVGSVAVNAPVARSPVEDIVPRAIDVASLQGKLSSKARIYFPGSKQFANQSTRWSILGTPTVSVVVSVGTAQDVAAVIKFANAFNIPFLAFNGAHGATTTLSRMKSGIEINLWQLSSVTIAKDGKSATIGGGTMSKKVTDVLWAAGKQTVTGTCECVGYMGPGLGGGHGWLQGHHGLVSDQWTSAQVVLADGSIKTVDARSDLWYALKGAGHNFAIVTSVTTKIYDIVHRDWAIETIIFSGSQVKEVYEASNDVLLANGTQPEGLISWSYWLNIPPFDAEHPVIMLYIIQEGVKAVDSKYTQAFHDLNPINIAPQSGDFNDLAGWTGIALDSIPCQKLGTANPRFPLYLDTYNVAAMEKAYGVFSENVSGNSPYNNSLFMFEGYSVEGVQAISSSTAAFAFRSEHILSAPLITYVSDKGGPLDIKAAKLGNDLRNILVKGTCNKPIRAYVNYSFGNESPADLYGSDTSRLSKLKALKKKYDPKGKFSFYAPVA